MGPRQRQPRQQFPGRHAPRGPASQPTSLAPLHPPRRRAAGNRPVQLKRSIDDRTVKDRKGNIRTKEVAPTIPRGKKPRTDGPPAGFGGAPGGFGGGPPGGGRRW